MKVNKVFLAGNLTRDPELKDAGDGLVKFGMAVNDYKDKAHFFEVVAFNRGTYELANIIEKHFSKGDPIFIEGKLDYSSWTTKDGGKRSQVGVIVDNFQFTGGKGKAKEEEAPF